MKLFFLAILEVASHADVLSGSSRVPAPLCEVGTRDEPENVCVGGFTGG